MTYYLCGAFARFLVIHTLLAGVGFHVTRLVIGVEAFQALFTPTVDAAFSVPIILAILAMFGGWPVFRFRRKADKPVVMITLAYFTLSVPLHVQTWFTQDTSYILSFPWWYSLIFIGYSSLLVWVWARLRVRLLPDPRF
jgi:hypothetical protein